MSSKPITASARVLRARVTAAGARAISIATAAPTKLVTVPAFALAEAGSGGP